MYTIFKIVCIIVLMIGAGVNYLMVAFADDEHDNFHGVVCRFFGATCLLGAIFMSLYCI